MYQKIVILKIIPDTTNGGAELVTIGLFDIKGVLQLEIPRVSGKLFPKDVRVGQEFIFAPK
jgi:hypothetical protein